MLGNFHKRLPNYELSWTSNISFQLNFPLRIFNNLVPASHSKSYNEKASKKSQKIDTFSHLTKNPTVYHKKTPSSCNFALVKFTHHRFLTKKTHKTNNTHFKSYVKGP